MFHPIREFGNAKTDVVDARPRQRDGGLCSRSVPQIYYKSKRCLRVFAGGVPITAEQLFSDDSFWRVAVRGWRPWCRKGARAGPLFILVLSEPEQAGADLDMASNGTYEYVKSALFEDALFMPNTYTPPKQIFGYGVDWSLLEIPIHGLSNFFVPLIVYAINCAIFDEKMPPDEKTTRTSIKQHLRHAIECSISLWVWQSLLLNINREEPDLSTMMCVRNLVVHFLLSDALFFWCHYACHQRSTYELVHKQHHTHKATPGAETKMNALSGTWYAANPHSRGDSAHACAYAPRLRRPLRRVSRS